MFRCSVGKDLWLAYMEPMIQMTAAIWMDVFRDILSAMKDEARVPKNEPPGMEPVMAP